ncbi:hypothetical protein EV363DRAFT_1417906 [Boletus edulis]|nr:hypothetical protein EV363DRAFT_1417906 [Boletus edulis]
MVRTLIMHHDSRLLLSRVHLVCTTTLCTLAKPVNGSIHLMLAALPGAHLGEFLPWMMYLPQARVKDICLHGCFMSWFRTLRDFCSIEIYGPDAGHFNPARHLDKNQGKQTLKKKVILRKALVDEFASAGISKQIVAHRYRRGPLRDQHESATDARGWPIPIDVDGYMDDSLVYV